MSFSMVNPFWFIFRSIQIGLNLFGLQSLSQQRTPCKSFQHIQHLQSITAFLLLLVFCLVLVILLVQNVSAARPRLALA